MTVGGGEICSPAPAAVFGCAVGNLINGGRLVLGGDAVFQPVFSDGRGGGDIHVGVRVRYGSGESAGPRVAGQGGAGGGADAGLFRDVHEAGE